MQNVDFGVLVEEEHVGGAGSGLELAQSGVVNFLDGRLLAVDAELRAQHLQGHVVRNHKHFVVLRDSRLLRFDVVVALEVRD